MKKILMVLLLISLLIGCSSSSDSNKTYDWKEEVEQIKVDESSTLSEEDIMRFGIIRNEIKDNESEVVEFDNYFAQKLIEYNLSEFYAGDLYSGIYKDNVIMLNNLFMIHQYSFLDNTKDIFETHFKDYIKNLDDVDDLVVTLLSLKKYGNVVFPISDEFMKEIDVEIQKSFTYIKNEIDSKPNPSQFIGQDKYHIPELKFLYELAGIEEAHTYAELMSDYYKLNDWK